MSKNLESWRQLEGEYYSPLPTILSTPKGGDGGGYVNALTMLDLAARAGANAEAPEKRATRAQTRRTSFENIFFM